jgi:hypothetical protein
VTGRRGLDPGDDLRELGVLEQVAGRARPDCIQHLVVVGDDGEHQDRDIRVFDEQHARGVDPGGARHVHVHDDDLGAERACGGERRGRAWSVDGLVSLLLEQRPQAGAEQIVVVHDHDT